MAETWRVLRHGAGSPAWNMAVDEALLRHSSTPTLRLYRWDRPAVSLGYFQNWSIAPADRPFVRRYTGGGLVDHAQDVTYTIAAPRTHFLGKMSTADSYALIHRGVARALHQLNLVAVLTPETWTGDDTACFQKAVKFDVVRDQQKLAGAAQRRTRQGFLQQGSILLPDPLLNPRLHEILVTALATEISFLEQEGELTQEEITLAEQLSTERYASDVWNKQR